MAVPKIELRDGEWLLFERFNMPGESPWGTLWKVDSKGRILETLSVPDGDSFKKALDAGKSICSVWDLDFGSISLEDAQKLFSKSEDSE